jgi:hypothetical protein
MIEINYWEQRLPMLQSTEFLFRRLEIIEVSLDISGNKNNEIKVSKRLSMAYKPNLFSFEQTVKSHLTQVKLLHSSRCKHSVWQSPGFKTKGISVNNSLEMDEEQILLLQSSNYYKIIMNTIPFLV